MVRSASFQAEKGQGRAVNIFEKATRIKLRFPSEKGELTLEQLWDVPLRSKASEAFSLDTIAKGANAALEKVSENSFVDSTRNPAQEKCSLVLDVIKHVIKVKLGEEQRAAKRADLRVEEERLKEILAGKRDEALAGLSETQLTKRLNEIRKAQQETAEA